MFAGRIIQRTHCLQDYYYFPLTAASKWLIGDGAHSKPISTSTTRLSGANYVDMKTRGLTMTMAPRLA